MREQAAKDLNAEYDSQKNAVFKEKISAKDKAAA